MKFNFLHFLLISTFFSANVYAANLDTVKPTAGENSVLERKNYSNMPAPAGAYSIAVRHNNTLYLSGITAVGTPAQHKGQMEQAKVIFEQIKQITEAEGISLENLIKVTIYVTSLDDVATLRQFLSAQFSGNHPASSMIRVAELAAPGLNIEVEAIFALPENN